MNGVGYGAPPGLKGVAGGGSSSRLEGLKDSFKAASAPQQPQFAKSVMSEVIKEVMSGGKPEKLSIKAKDGTPFSFPALEELASQMPLPTATPNVRNNLDKVVPYLDLSMTNRDGKNCFHQLISKNPVQLERAMDRLSDTPMDLPEVFGQRADISPGFSMTPLEYGAILGNLASVTACLDKLNQRDPEGLKSLLASTDKSGVSLGDRLEQQRINIEKYK